MAKNKSARLADTKVVKGRSSRAEELELERLEIKREMEKIMAQYAKITGLSELGSRRYKVGKAPNDYRSEE